MNADNNDLPGENKPKPPVPVEGKPGERGVAPYTSNAPAGGGKAVAPRRPSAVGDAAPRSAKKPERVDYDEVYSLKGSDIHGRRTLVRAVDKQEDDDDQYEDEGDIPAASIFVGLLKILLYIAVVIVAAGILGYNAVLIGNDAFAFVKPEVEAEVTIPEYPSMNEVAQILFDNGIINYKNAFSLYNKLRGRGGEITGGTYSLSSTMSYDDLVKAMSPKKARVEVRVTIPEGYTIDQTVALFLSLGIGTREGFDDVIKNYPFEQRFLSTLDPAVFSKNRKYRLEGYLFPDTYNFYTDSSERAVIARLLDNFGRKFPNEFYSRAEMLGFTIDQIVTIASIIEREAKFPEDYPLVASVIHNRLRNPGFPNLECDSTILYNFDEHREPTGEDMRLDLPYNTYLYPGLPPSAICNPGYEALYNALYPEETNYLYFVSDKKGNILYASTLAQHNANIIKARSG